MKALIVRTQLPSKMLLSGELHLPLIFTRYCGGRCHQAPDPRCCIFPKILLYPLRSTFTTFYDTTQINLLLCEDVFVLLIYGVTYVQLGISGCRRSMTERLIVNDRMGNPGGVPMISPPKTW